MNFKILIFVLTCEYEFGKSMEPCITSSGVVCHCTDDSRIALCQRLHLQSFPVLNTEILNFLEEIHATSNDIKTWPNATIWNKMKLLKYIDITDNPICTLPDHHKDIKIDISPCEYIFNNTITNLIKNMIKVT